MMRRIVACLAVVTLLTGMMSSFVPGKASAASGGCYFGNDTCSVSGNGDYGTNDVFTGRDSSGNPDVLRNINSKPDFIAFINNRFGGNAHNKTGAQFIMARMMGITSRPGSTTKWDNLMRQDSVSFQIVRSATVYKTSWYDPGKNNTFFDNYSNPGSRTRDVIDITQGGKIIARVEIACGNMTALQEATLDGWGDMQGSSSVVAQAYPGQTVTWSHSAWDNGAEGSATSDTVNGNVKWTGGGWTTGPVPAGNGAVGGDVSPDKSYGRRFAAGTGDAVNRSYAFTIPAGTVGKRYCQQIYGDNTSYQDHSNFASATACVLVVPPPNITPGTSLSPNPVGVGQNYTATATFSNSSGLAGDATGTWRTWLDNGDQTYGSGDQSVNGPTTRTISVSPGTTNFGTYNGTADATHAYVCTELRITSVGSGVTTSPGSENPPPAGSLAADKTCSPIVARPYFTVLGGDVAAGAGFGVAGASGASIIGTNNDGSTNYNGASGQLAALALGSVKSFTTSQSPNGGVGPAWTNSLAGGYAPSALGFANTSPPVGGTTYGGGFTNVATAKPWTVPDYYGTTAATTPFPGSSANVAAGNYTHSGSLLTLNASNIPTDGRKIVLKVNGDVYISGNITYGASATNAVGSADQIPLFELIVSGNIYVDPSVTELDGFYAAQGNGTTTGRFASCANASGPIIATPGNEAATIASCNQPTLVVNGAVAAQKVILNRTYGDINGGGIPQAPGETIRFSPMLWVPNAIGGSDVSGWQSVTSLPPIL